MPAPPKKKGIAVNTQEKLDRLAELDANRDVVILDMESLKNSVIPVEIKEKLNEIDAEFNPHLEAIAADRAQLEAEIRNDVMVSGESAAGDVYRASYVKGRVSWNTEALDGYALTHPEINICRKKGAPSVRIVKR